MPKNLSMRGRAEFVASSKGLVESHPREMPLGHMIASRICSKIIMSTTDASLVMATRRVCKLESQVTELSISDKKIVATVTAKSSLISMVRTLASVLTTLPRLVVEVRIGTKHATRTIGALPKLLLTLERSTTAINSLNSQFAMRRRITGILAIVTSLIRIQIAGAVEEARLITARDGVKNLTKISVSIGSKVKICHMPKTKVEVEVV